IPDDQDEKTRSINTTGSNLKQFKKIGNLHSAEVNNSCPVLKDIDKTKNEVKDKLYFKPFYSLIPRINFKIDKSKMNNSKIPEIRDKLNEITKKQDDNVDNRTRSMINDNTQQLVEDKEGDVSGPYSLLYFDRQDKSASFNQEKTEESLVKEVLQKQENEEWLLNKNRCSYTTESIERLPNVLNFDNKPMKEFEYSCEKDLNYRSINSFKTHSRSDLCLQLKTHAYSRNIETNLSPNDNSLSRNNEENSLDDSLGILTPDQMDDICYLENSFSPTVENLPCFSDTNTPDKGDTPSTDKTETNSAASTIHNDVLHINVRNPHDLSGRLSHIEAMNIIGNNENDGKVAKNSSDLSKSTFDNILCKSAHPNIDQDDTLEQAELCHSDLIEDEFLPSVHGSILEPPSCLADNTVHLDVGLEGNNSTHIISNRIEQTPSPDDLPLDNSDINGEISTYSQFSASTLLDSNTFSDSKSNDYTKSMDTSKVSNSFITSITSITSLDGYQGDGEMSRPVSRSAERIVGPREDGIDMDWQNIPVPRRPDPMTDSDFFTESDADGLDDHMHRGDRRAQVIDGALYGGKNKNGNHPLIVNRSEDSCMESSGVYTDFENHRTSPVFLNILNDISPTSTISSHSDCSQKHLDISKENNIYYSPLKTSLDGKDTSLTRIIGDETPKIPSKRNSLNSEKEMKCNEKNKEEKRFTLKKYKMPKRDVPSKLKTMLQSKKIDSDTSTPNSVTKTAKKQERSFLKKNILELKSDYKISPFKDVKAKVDCSFSLQRSQTSCSVTRMLSSKSPNPNTKPKSRHMRMRMEKGSANGSGKSSMHSSQSDLSATSIPVVKHGSSRFPLLS
ncbi:unnamed protein product, partial [Leptidea sinapis]